MMPERVVSTIIPCYNQAHFLGEAIQSVLAQAYAAIEIIVVNDGSPDDTRNVALQFGDRIRYIEQENRGLASARNTGIRAASGEYIALLDSDDVCLPGRLTTQAAYLDAHAEVGAVFSDAILYEEDHLVSLKSQSSGKPQNPEDFRWETVAFCPTPSTAMIRRRSFATTYFDERLRRAGEDWLFAVQLALDYPLAYLETPTILYRIHSDSATQQMELINSENRKACLAAVTWRRFGEYPAHFRAKLLFYRFATAWHSESKSAALAYFLQATRTDPAQIPYGLRVLKQGLSNTIARFRKGK